MSHKSQRERVTIGFEVAGPERCNASGTYRTSARVAEAIPAPEIRRLGLFGCPLDTGNLGVSALGLATIRGLHDSQRGFDFTMFDYGQGTRGQALSIGNDSFDVRFIGCYYSRRLYATNNTAQMLIAAKLGLRRIHPMLRRLGEFDALLDMSGGDSFSDIYGSRRFASVSLPKLIALQLGIPLILLPQTYGPYRSHKARRVARSILRGASQVWARDKRSLGVVRELLLDEFDPSRHLNGVDVAFGLPVMRPGDSEIVDSVCRFRDAQGVLVGLNISGLLYNDPDGSTRRFGLVGSYRELIHSLVDRLLRREDIRIMLIPHVASKTSNVDCDVSACSAVLERLEVEHKQRALLVPPTLNAMEAKWVIGQSDWFCGTRMHACIAAISQGVPTAALAYSDKTRGVFETAGIGDSVVDPRKTDVVQTVEHVLAEFELRAATVIRLRDHLPDLRRRLKEQFESIATCIR